MGTHLPRSTVMSPQTADKKQAGNKPDEEPLPVEGIVVVSFGHVLGAGDDPPPGVAEPLVGTSG